MIKNIVLFDKPGKENTYDTIQIAREKALRTGIRRVVVASTTGYSALCAAEVFFGTGIEIIAVGIDTYGWSQDKERRKELEKANIKLLPCSIYFNDEVSNILRCFSQGVKVALEIAVMAAEAGMIPESESTIALGGTGFGTDTAILLKPASKININKLKVQEILCMPGNKYTIIKPK